MARRLGLILRHRLVQHVGALLPLLLQVRQLNAHLGEALLLRLLLGGARGEQRLLLRRWLDARGWRELPARELPEPSIEKGLSWRAR